MITEQYNMQFLSDLRTNLSEMLKSEEDDFFRECWDFFDSGEQMSNLLAKHGHDIEPRKCRRIRARQVKRLASRDRRAIEVVIRYERQMRIEKLKRAQTRSRLSDLRKRQGALSEAQYDAE